VTTAENAATYARVTRTISYGELTKGISWATACAMVFMVRGRWFVRGDARRGSRRCAVENSQRVSRIAYTAAAPVFARTGRQAGQISKHENNGNEAGQVASAAAAASMGEMASSVTRQRNGVNDNGDRGMMAAQRQRSAGVSVARAAS